MPCLGKRRLKTVINRPVEAKEEDAGLDGGSRGEGGHLRADIGQPDEAERQRRAGQRPLGQGATGGPGGQRLADEHTSGELQPEDPDAERNDLPGLGGEIRPCLADRQEGCGERKRQCAQGGAGMAPHQEAEAGGGDEEAGEETDGDTAGPEEGAHARRMGPLRQRLVSVRRTEEDGLRAAVAAVTGEEVQAWDRGGSEERDVVFRAPERPADRHLAPKGVF